MKKDYIFKIFMHNIEENEADEIKHDLHEILNDAGITNAVEFEEDK